MSQSDLFALLGIEVETTQSSTKSKDKKNVDVKSTASKATTAQARKSETAKQKYSTREGIRKMPIPVQGWTIHYATHTFEVEHYARQLVDMGDETPLEKVKDALWTKVPEDVRADILKAREKQENSNDKVQSETVEEEDNLDIDEDSGEVREKNIAKKEKKPEDLYDGDMTIAMIEQAFAYDYFEFASSEAISWRVDRENKRLFPAVTNGKWGAYSTGTRRLYWKWQDYLKDTDKPPIGVVAGRQGRLFDVREDDFMRIVAPSQLIRELDIPPEGFHLNLDKIPGEFLVQTVAFFKHFAQQEPPVEAAVYITWNKEKHSYALHCPRQRVSLAEVRADFPHFLDDPDTRIVVYIHSHHLWPADFSGQDDANDKAFAVYGVIGRLNLPMIDMRFRAGFNGQHYEVSAKELFDFSDVTYSDQFPLEWLACVERE
ncbi:hypothetical protein B1A99_24970 [Cohnella sp. CIP 111063]|uniref:Mov34/MPN/PAD-1 family protein n=1 Tax=unclassified Cohnella TaxID=2636738 RepID=UPI000B8BC436|nr:MULTISPECIES: Mov34/MPN/PAD-1 family protein [unclassified Cohnella]OXS55035.1 hypothetical protein B1A99_24970 [Cohnella sp. CIP 111063]